MSVDAFPSMLCKFSKDRTEHHHPTQDEETVRQLTQPYNRFSVSASMFSRVSFLRSIGAMSINAPHIALHGLCCAASVGNLRVYTPAKSRAKSPAPNTASHAAKHDIANGSDIQAASHETRNTTATSSLLLPPPPTRLTRDPTASQSPCEIPQYPPRRTETSTTAFLDLSQPSFVCLIVPCLANTARRALFLPVQTKPLGVEHVANAWGPKWSFNVPSIPRQSRSTCPSRRETTPAAATTSSMRKASFTLSATLVSTAV